MLRFEAGFRPHRGAGGVGDTAQGILHAVACADRGPRLCDEHLRRAYLGPRTRPQIMCYILRRA